MPARDYIARINHGKTAGALESKEVDAINSVFSRKPKLWIEPAHRARSRQSCFCRNYRCPDHHHITTPPLSVDNFDINEFFNFWSRQSPMPNNKLLDNGIDDSQVAFPS
jgi:hypothetical protein